MFHPALVCQRRGFRQFVEQTIIGGKGAPWKGGWMASIEAAEGR
jgi:hypothetical protein